MLNLKRLAKDRWLTQHDMAKILGVAQSKVSELMNRPERIKPDIIEQLNAHFGEDVVKAYMVDDEAFTAQTREATVTIIDPSTLAEIKKDIREEEAIPMLPAEIAIEPEQNIREYISEMGSELEQINPSQLLNRAQVAERILHTSMFPTFQPEDIVFIRFIPHGMEIVDGNIYYIDSKNYPTLIRKIKIVDDKRLRLIAQNRQFADIIINRSDINNLGSIVGMLRMNFGNQYDELEEMRTRKDNHLERMMEMVERQNEQQGKLIDFITKNRDE